MHLQAIRDENITNVARLMARAAQLVNTDFLIEHREEIQRKMIVAHAFPSLQGSVGLWAYTGTSTVGVQTEAAYDNSPSKSSGFFSSDSGSRDEGSVKQKAPAFRRKKKFQRPRYCVFCKNNGKSETEYMSHVTLDDEKKVVCPILFRYNCPICNNGGGDHAHTRTHCPKYNPAIHGV